jgi:hypothetical protein
MIVNSANAADLAGGAHGLANSDQVPFAVFEPCGPLTHAFVGIVPLDVGATYGDPSPGDSK